MNQKIGLIGLGNMGSAFLDKLIIENIPVGIWNRSIEKTEQYKKNENVAIFSNVESLIEHSEIIFVIINGYDNVSQLFEKLANIKNKIVINFTTGSPQDAEQLSNVITKKNAHYFDGAIMNFPSQIATSEALFILSGPVEQFENIKPILNVFSQNIEIIEEGYSLPNTLDCAMTGGMYEVAIVSFLNTLAFGKKHGLPESFFTPFVDNFCHMLSIQMKKYINEIEQQDFQNTEAFINSFAASSAIFSRAFIESGTPNMALKAVSDVINTENSTKSNLSLSALYI